MLCRVVNMRGVNLNLFDFDYDLTWSGFFLNADGGLYGRYGGRNDQDAEKHLTLNGLKYAMTKALRAHKENPQKEADRPLYPPSTPEDLPAAKQLKSNACIHCHMVYDFRRETLRSENRFTEDDIWTYPPPENLGLMLDVSAGNRLADVKQGSPAAKAGLKPGDVLESVNGMPAISYADVQYALQQAPKSGAISVVFDRAGGKTSVSLPLAEGWRKSDISWRGSMWSLEPKTSIYGEDLKPDERKSLGLTPRQLAFRQGDYVPPRAKAAGILARDLIVGVDDLKTDMTMLQFQVYMRLNHKAGDRVVYHVIRGGKRLEIPFVMGQND